MAVYLVTWNLNQERGVSAYSIARDALMKRFEAYARAWDQRLESVRFIESDSTAAQIRDHLSAALDDNDAIFVTRLRAQEAAWQMSAVPGDWINGRHL